MVFSSLQFILIFMPIFFACYYAVSGKYKNAVLLLGSLVFYFIGTQGHPFHFILFVISITADFYIGLAIERFNRTKRALLTLGIVFHLVCLCTFKYSDFAIAELSRLISPLDTLSGLVLPIGISFYTFQGISYIADVYRGSVKAEKSLLNYAVYISMFEQLIAGPIVTYATVEKELSSRTVNAKTALRGLGTFIFGLALKVLLANPLGKLWSQAEAIGFESISTPLAWMAIIAYSFQIYFDFFGYSLMAVGLGKMLGFSLPKNFDHPYTSLTMTEFWRRWHITLGSWFREYVYFPLGGSRNGRAKTVLNLLAVWLLTGIWHGAGYNFIIWGAVLFAVITTEKFVTGKFLNSHPTVGHIYMALLIPLTWSVFAVSDLNSLFVFLGRLFPFFGSGVWSVYRLDYLKYLKQFFPFLAVGLVFSTKLPYRLLKKIKSNAVTVLLLSVLLLASLYCMYRGLDDPFLYFRF